MIKLKKIENHIKHMHIWNKIQTHIEPYCQKHNTSNLVFSPRPAAILSTPAVALRTTPLLCRARSFSASLFSRRRRSFNWPMDQWIRRQDRSFAATLPSCGSSGRQTSASLCAVTWGSRLRSSIVERRSADRRRQKQNSHADRRMAVGNTLTELTKLCTLTFFIYKNKWVVWW